MSRQPWVCSNRMPRPRTGTCECGHASAEHTRTGDTITCDRCTVVALAARPPVRHVYHCENTDACQCCQHQIDRLKAEVARLTALGIKNLDEYADFRSRVEALLGDLRRA